VELDFWRFLIGGGGLVGSLARLEREVDLLGGLVVGGEGLVGSLALNWDRGKVLLRGEDGRELLGGGEGEESFPGLALQLPLSKALILSAIGMDPTAESRDILPKIHINKR